MLFVSIYRLCPRFERIPCELLLIDYYLHVISGAAWWKENKGGNTK